jgi:hypothetical protein
VTAAGHLSGYATPDALWNAVNSRIAQSVKTNPTATVTNPQRQFVYDRFLARVFSTDDHTWVLKGGTALLARVRSARHSQDVDLFRQGGTIDAAVAELQRAAALGLGDHFRFVTGAVVTRPERPGQPGTELATVKIDGYAGVRKIAISKVDLAIGSVITADPEPLRPDLTVSIEGLPTPDYLLYPLPDHIADKICATFELHGTAQLSSSRVRDFVDLVVIARTQTVHAAALRTAIEAEQRHRNLAPITAWAAPEGWRSRYARAARDVAECAEHRTYNTATDLVARFLDPVLSGALSDSAWQPGELLWTPSAGPRPT